VVEDSAKKNRADSKKGIPNGNSIRVVRDTNARTIHLVQDAYIDEVAAKYHIISTGRPSEVPMLVNYLEQSLKELNEARTKTY
jgi:hypothetical protein